MSSAAFKRGRNPDPEVSVDLARLASPEECLRRADRPTHGIGSLTAAIPRAMGLTVRHDPVEGNDAHSVIEGQTDRSQPRQLAARVTIIIVPAPLRSASNLTDIDA
ncbi:MAG: hypothetical protein U0893_01405 [Chloroflexota bacterium]